MKLTKSLTFEINRSVPETMPHFINMKNYVKLHPLMIKTDLVSENKYKLYEKPFAWLPFKVTYFANVSASNNTVSYVLNGIPFTKAHFDYNFTATSATTTTVNLTIQLNGLPLVNQIIMKLIVDAQHTIFEALATK